MDKVILLITVIQFFLSVPYFCMLHVHCCENTLWSTAAWPDSHERNKTDRDFVHYDSGIIATVLALCHNLFSLDHRYVRISLSLSLLTFVRVKKALVVLFRINSFVNPILYAIRMPEFKRALASLFCCTPQQRQVVLVLRDM